MFFFLSKILYYAIMPLVWVLALLLASLLFRKPSYKRRCVITALALLAFFSNPYIVNEAYLLWEDPVKPMAEVKNYQTGVLLTGVTNLYRLPNDRVYFQKGADRVLHTLQLYRMGKIKRILISGGSGSITRPDAGEADELKQVLLLAQVPEQDIVLEEKSRNTYENALYSAKVLKQLQAQEPVLLITSAFHMRRSAGCFKKQGVQFDTFSTDFYSVDRSLYTLDKLLVPQEESLYIWHKLIHELLGYATYWLLGYL